MLEEENVQVVIRIRPMQASEKKQGDISCVKAAKDGKEVQVKVGPLDAQCYRCNQCFPSDTSQTAFFNESGITTLIDSAIEGYRTCAFAFGQTGAGKTFTMLGPSLRGSLHQQQQREKQMGIVPRSLEYLFSRLQGRTCSIKLSCLEIYHEQVFDLFAEEKGRTALSVREHADEGFYLEGAKMIDCSNNNNNNNSSSGSNSISSSNSGSSVALAALEVALRNRQTGAHDLNSRSSRSHCVTEVYIELPVKVNSDGSIESNSRSNSSNGNNSNSSNSSGSQQQQQQQLQLPEGEYISRGKISLVDLAGSERLKSTKSTGKVLQEAGFINRSLYVLGKVIAGLVRTNGDLNHKDVPYRDSKLTKLLISSLGGRGRTLLISCVGEAKGSQTETLRTLKFSMSCARIRNKPVKFLDPQEKLILELRQEIFRLRSENKKLRSTILTAPAGTLGTAVASTAVATATGGEDVDADVLSLHSQNSYNSYNSHRSFSAQSGLSAGKKKGAQQQQLRGRKKKKSTAAAARMRSSRSDFTGAVGVGVRSAYELQQVGLTPVQQQQQQQHRSAADLTTPTAAAAATVEEEEGDDLLGSLLAEDAHIRAGLDAMSGDLDGDSVTSATSHNNNNNNRRNSNSSGRQQQQQQQRIISSRDAVEDNVRRRATGPMILKDNAIRNIIPIRESKFGEIGPANNLMRSKEAERIVQLEKRIARMERDEKKRVKLSKGETVNSEDDKIEVKKKRKKFLTKHESEHIAWKAKQKNNGTSPYIAHLVDKPKKSSTPATASNSNSNNSINSGSSGSSVRDSLMEELAALGLDDSTATAASSNTTAAAAAAAASGRKKQHKATAATAATTATAATGAVNKQRRGIAAAAANSPKKKGVALPNIATATAAKSKAQRPPLSGKVTTAAAATATAGKEENVQKLPAIGNRSQQQQQQQQQEDEEQQQKRRRDNLGTFLENAAANAVQPTERFANLKDKLEELEDSLARERIRMEDDPGAVGEEDEQRYRRMLLEAKEMRQELIASGIIITFTTGDKSKSRSQSFINSSSDGYNNSNSSVENERSLVPLSVRKMMDEMDAVNASATATADALMASRNNDSRGSSRGNNSRNSSSSSSNVNDGSRGNSRSKKSRAAGGIEKKLSNVDEEQPETHNSRSNNNNSGDNDDYEDDYEDEFEDDDFEKENEDDDNNNATDVAAAIAATAIAAAAAAEENNKKKQELEAEKHRAEKEAAAVEEARIAAELQAQAAAEERKRIIHEQERAAAAEKAAELDRAVAAEKAEAEWKEAERIAAENAAAAKTTTTEATTATAAEEEEEDDYEDDDFDETDDGDTDANRNDKTPNKKRLKTPDAAARSNSNSSSSSGIDTQSQQQHQLAVNTTAIAANDDEATATAAAEETDGPPFKKYDYYSGNYSELKAPLETKVVGYVSNVNIASQQVEFGSRSHNSSHSNSHSRSSSQAKLIDSRRSSDAVAMSPVTSPVTAATAGQFNFTAAKLERIESNANELGNASFSAPAAAASAESSYVPSSSSRNSAAFSSGGTNKSPASQAAVASTFTASSAVAAATSASVVKSGSDDDDDDYLHFALYGADSKISSAAATTTAAKATADNGSNSLVKKQSPISITASDEIEVPSKAATATVATAATVEESYGGDEFDDYDVSFDEEEDA